MRERIVILGAGESGVGAALLAQQNGYDVFVSDASLINPAFKNELLAGGIDFEEGMHTRENIVNAALIVKSPGIPEKNALVRELRETGIEMISEIEFAYRYKRDSKI